MKKTARLALPLAFALALSIASGAQAADDGNTKPRLSNGLLNSSNTSVDIIPLTSGAGNIKGFQCIVTPGTGFYPNLRLHFYVDGAAVQTIDPLVLTHTDANGDQYTELIPMNIRFGTSIRVNLQRLSGGGTGGVACYLTWGLD